MRRSSLTLADLISSEHSSCLLTEEDQKLANNEWGALELEEVSEASALQRIYPVLWNYFGERGELETQAVLLSRLAWPGLLTPSPQARAQERLQENSQENLQEWPKDRLSESNPIQRGEGHAHSVERSLGWLKYHLWVLRSEGEVVAVRDHSVMVYGPSAEDKGLHSVVHLSHLWIAPRWRRQGLSPWLRAWPVLSAVDALQSVADSLPLFGSSHLSKIDLVSEMEPLDPEDPETTLRQKSYQRGGFEAVRLPGKTYLQPDFRSPEVIDCLLPSGEKDSARGLPLELLVRRFFLDGRAKRLQALSPLLGTLPSPSREHDFWVRALYEMYGKTFRPQDMAVCYQNLEGEK